MNLPDGVTSEMVEALRRGEKVQMADGTPVRLYRPYAPLSGEYGEPSVYVARPPEGGLPKIRLMPEWGGAQSPLWPSSEETDALVPKQLLERLIAWQQDFQANCHWKSGWRSEEAKVRWTEQGKGLEVEVRAALEGKAELVVDLWPLERPRPPSP